MNRPIITIGTWFGFLLPGIFLFCGSLQGQNQSQITRMEELKAIDRNLVVQWDKRSSVPLRLKGRLSQPMEGDAGAIVTQFFRANAPLFRMTDPGREMKIISVKKTAGDWEHVRLQQVFDGIPVEGKVALVHIGPNRIVQEVRISFLPLKSVDTSPVVSQAQAIEFARSNLKATNVYRQPPMAQLVLYPRDTAVFLAWKVRLRTESPLGDFISYIDAKNGAVLEWYNNLKTMLRRNTYDAMHGQTLPGTLWKTDEGAAATDQILERIHQNAKTTYTFWWATYHLDGFDGEGDTIKSVGHFGVNYNNAFWDSPLLVFGDGDGATFSPLGMALDIYAHEFAHAVTEHMIPSPMPGYPGGLVYKFQPGALSESYSDIFGVLVEPPDWLMGEDSYTPGTAGDALRNLANPPLGNPAQPDHMSIYSVSSLWDDNGGVHTNSGIPNKVAYLMSEGGTHHGIAVAGMGRANMGRVFYDSYDWLTQYADFHDAREATMSAARAIFLNDPPKVTTVDNAWRAVGISALDIRLYKEEQLHPEPDGGRDLDTVVVTVGYSPVIGATLLFMCENTNVATVSPVSAITDNEGKAILVVTGHRRGSTSLRVTAAIGADSAFVGVPVKVPTGSVGMVVVIVFMAVLGRSIIGKNHMG